MQVTDQRRLPDLMIHLQKTVANPDLLPPSPAFTASTGQTVKTRPRPARGLQAKPSRDNDELGPLLATYRGRQLSRSDIWTLFLPGTAAVMAPLLYGAWLSNYAYTHYGPVAADFWSRPWFLLATLALLTFTILLIYRLRLARRFVTVYKLGLRMNLGGGLSRSSTHLRWEQISGIAAESIQEYLLHIPLRTYQRAVLYPDGGKPMRIDGLQNLPELISRIKASVYARLLPTLRARLEAGQWLNFGPVSIHSKSLRIHQHETHWRQVEQVTVQAGFLMVELKNKSRHRHPVSQIPNLEIMLQLIQQGVNA